MTIWQRRIQALTDAGMTKAKIAHEADCTRGAITRIANGTRKDPVASIALRIIELCELVGVDIKDEAAE